MTAETVSLINPTLCQHNKFQPLSRRTFTDDELSDLRNITERGLDYPINVFYLDHNGTAFVVKDGWRRVSAWLRWRPGEMIPALVEDPPTDDRELLTTTVVTNESRENLNVIQKADLLTEGITLGMTQAQAGKLFNPPIGQAAVSHILSLRKLPTEIKALVETGDVPERIARQLVTLSKHAPNHAIAAAKEIAQTAPERKDTQTGMSIRTAYATAGPYLSEQYAIYKWPTTERDARAEAKADEGEPTTIATCVDCPFNVEFGNMHFCMRPACYGLKTRLLKDEQTKKQDAARAKSAKFPAAKLVSHKVIEKSKTDVKREADLTECRRLIAAALDALVGQMPKLPEPYLTLFLANPSDITYFDGDHVPEWLHDYDQLDRRAAAKLKPAEKQHFAAGAFIAAQLNDYNMTPASVTKAAEAMAKEWKLRLPKNWNIAPNTATPSPKEKRNDRK